MADDFEFDISGNMDELRSSIDDLADHLVNLGTIIEQRIGDQTNQIEQQLSDTLGAAESWGTQMAAIGAAAFAAWKIGGAAIEAVTAALQDCTSEVTSWIQAAIEADQIDAQLANSLRATGREAEFTVESLSATATALESITTFGDEAIRSAQLIQLRFGEIKGENFERVTELALDMAVQSGDAASSALALSRALQHPANAMGILRRHQIEYGPVQQETVKGFLRMGETAKAQQVILDAVEKSVGNNAETAAQASGGGWKQLLNIFENVREELGHKLMPLIEEMIPAFKFSAQEAVKAILAISEELADMTVAFTNSLAVDPAEVMVAALAGVLNICQKIAEEISHIGSAWRAAKLALMEFNDAISPEGGMGIGMFDQLKFVKLTEEQISLQKRIGTADESGRIPGHSQNKEQLEARLAAVREEIKLISDRDQKATAAWKERQKEKQELRGRVADDVMFRVEGSKLPSQEEAMRSAIENFRSSRSTEKAKREERAAEREETRENPLVLPPEALEFMKIWPKFTADMKGLKYMGRVAEGNFDAKMPPWVDSLKESFKSIVGGKGTVAEKLGKLSDDLTGRAGDALEAGKDRLIKPLLKSLKDDKPEVRLENFQSMFSRITTAAATRGDTPAKRTEENTKKTAENTKRHIELQERTLQFGEMSLRQLEALRKKTWGGLS